MDLNSGPTMLESTHLPQQMYSPSSLTCPKHREGNLLGPHHWSRFTTGSPLGSANEQHQQEVRRREESEVHVFILSTSFPWVSLGITQGPPVSTLKLCASVR